MLKAFQYRIYPSSHQEHLMQATLDECRWLYNHFLEVRKNAWEQDEGSLNYHAQAVTIPKLKEERPSLNQVYSQVLQNVAVRVDLAYKAESAGRKFVAVNPSYTSQDCSKCGHRQIIPLSERVYHCPCCDLTIDRDHNASLNILARGLASLASA